MHKEDPSIYEYVPCKVETSIKDDSDETIRLVLNNATIRDMTEQDKIQQYETLKEAVEQKIQSGEKVGVKRQYLAKLLQVSEAQIQRYKNISEKLIPELKEKINSGDIRITMPIYMLRWLPRSKKKIKKKVIFSSQLKNCKSQSKKYLKNGSNAVVTAPFFNVFQQF